MMGKDFRSCGVRRLWIDSAGPIDPPPRACLDDDASDKMCIIFDISIFPKKISVPISTSWWESLDDMICFHPLLSSLWRTLTLDLIGVRSLLLFPFSSPFSSAPYFFPSVSSRCHGNCLGREDSTRASPGGGEALPNKVEEEGRNY